MSDSAAPPEARATWADDLATDQPGITVVIPAYNRRALLPLAIASVRAQSLGACEIVVVDDGSTDQTAEWIARDHPDIRLIRLEERQGAPHARNLGVQVATSAVIAFLDSDDQFHPDKLRLQLAALQRQSAAFSTCGFVTDTDREYCTRPPRPGEILRRNCLGGSSGLLVWRALMLREPFDPDQAAVQEWELYIRLLRHGSVAHIPQALYHYDTLRGDRITRNHAQRLLGHKRLWHRHIDRAEVPMRAKLAHRSLHQMLQNDCAQRRLRSLVWRLIYRLLAR